MGRHPAAPAHEGAGRAAGDDRRVIHGILWRFRAGTPWRDVPERYGPRTTLYNRFVRWRAAGIWDRILDGRVRTLRRRHRNQATLAELVTPIREGRLQIRLWISIE